MRWEKTEPDSNWIVGNEETSQPSTAFPKRSAEMGSCRKIAIALIDPVTGVLSVIAWLRQLRSTCAGGILIFIALRKKLQAISAVIGKPRSNTAGSFPVATSTIPITRVKT
jgi:hypothetical protein